MQIRAYNLNMTSRKKQISKLATTASEIIMQPDQYEVAYMSRIFIQATLPHSDPGPVKVWGRTNGHFQLTITPHWTIDKQTGKEKCLGVPFGVIPRLILFWITTEVTKKEQNLSLTIEEKRKLYLGPSLSDFMRQLGLIPSGGRWGTIPRLKNQMQRLFRSKISVEYDELTNIESWADLKISSKGALWWDTKSPNQIPLWQSYILLDQDFYDAIKAKPVPVDMRILQAIKNSSLALDLYAWITCKTYIAYKNDKISFVPWRALQKQLGSNYSDVKNFQRKTKRALEKIQVLYSELEIEFVRGGLKIFPCSPSVPEKHRISK